MWLKIDAIMNSRSHMIKHALFLCSTIVLFMFLICGCQIRNKSQQTIENKSPVLWKALTGDYFTDSKTYVTSLALSSDKAMFVSTKNHVTPQKSGVYRSLDFGSSWVNLRSRMKDQDAESIIIDPHGVVYALGTSRSILFSLDNGDNWQYVNIAELQKYFISDMVIDAFGNLDIVVPFEGVLTYSRMRSELLPISMDKNFELEKLLYDASTNMFYGVIREDVVDEDALHGVEDHYFHLYSSSDSCRTWSSLLRDENGIESIAVDGTGTIIVGTNRHVSETNKSRLLLSRDKGQQWQTLGLDTVIASQICVCDSMTIVIGTIENTLLATNDLGKHWVDIGTGLPSERKINFVVFYDSYIYVGGWRIGVAKSAYPYKELLDTALTKQ